MVGKHVSLLLSAVVCAVCCATELTSLQSAIAIVPSKQQTVTLLLRVGKYPRITANVQPTILPVLTLRDDDRGVEWRLGVGYPHRQLVTTLDGRDRTIARGESIDRWYRVVLQTIVDKQRLRFHVFVDGKAVINRREMDLSLPSSGVVPSQLQLFDDQVEYAALDIEFQAAQLEILPRLLTLSELQLHLTKSMHPTERTVEVFSSLPLTAPTTMDLHEINYNADELYCRHEATEDDEISTPTLSSLVVIWCEAYNTRDEGLWEEECSSAPMQRRLAAIARTLPANTQVHVPLRHNQFQQWGCSSLQCQNVTALEIKETDSFGAAMNAAVRGAKEDAIIFTSSHLVHRHGWVHALLDSLGDNQYDVVGGVVLRPDHSILHAGLELMDLARPSETIILPHFRLRGYWPSDSRLLNMNTLHGLSKAMLAVRTKGFEDVHGFCSDFSPGLEDMGLSLRLQANGGKLQLAPDASAVSDVSLTFIPHQEIAYMSEMYDAAAPEAGHVASAVATQFWQKWREQLITLRRQDFVTDANFTWVMHCGGSQGIEATTILQSLHRFVNTRSIVRGYRECEHSNTIGGMPAYFRDVLEASATKTFGEPSHPDATGEIILYSRDYREIGRWVPYDAGYVIGRYMFEADMLPKTWANHCNRLDEVWVPSRWQKDAFIASGVQPRKVFVMKEAVDHHLYDPVRVAPLALPGSRLDGETPRPYTFLSVFKLEDRKGWMTLVNAYVREFAGVHNVNLVLRTYLHRAGDSGDIFDKDEIYRRIYDYLLKQPNMPEQDSWPSIDVVSEHIHSHNLPGLYKVCDAFVLPTHGEGWGLPTHEAMVMGLPVITTNWGGSTEFVNEQWAYPITVNGLSPTSKSDAWLRGFKWADPSREHLQHLMRHAYEYPDAVRLKGQLGRQYVLEHLNPDEVAFQYATRIAEIARHYPLQRAHGHETLSSFDRKWSLSAKFKSCAVNAKPQLAPSGPRTIADACDLLILTTYPPRECGIAIFAETLIRGIREVCPPTSRIEVMISAHGKDELLLYDPTLVKSSVYEFEQHEFSSAAEYANSRGFRTVLVQFEYGIFPGGALICMLKNLNARVVTTLHTVGRSMFEEYHAMLQQLALTSHKLVTMSQMMKRTLVAFHAIPAQDVHVIPHGVPDISTRRLQGTADQVAFAGKQLILSNGLLHPYKGIEYVIQAMPEVRKRHPGIAYLIQGKPHPTGINTREYYDYLIDQVVELGLQDIVSFNETFLSNDELHKLLQSTHIYVNAYTDSSQSVSGTLAMAFGTGTACISTPYPYAQELLANETGVLVPYRNSAAIAEAINHLLDDERRIYKLNQRAAAMADSMRWSSVARQYIELAMAG